MPSLLLTVTGVVPLRSGEWLVVDPEFDHPTAFGDVSVVLRRPDGTELAAAAQVIRPLVNAHPPVRLGKVCLLRGLSKGQVPVGTQVWLVDSDTA